ncbi:hypothetical protein BJ875DRAFT_381526 [Amylocarpus encephaloides]|uniref:Uncharacterized protein n=1 Tax=Amylocarpus encephaloides TaxID=45428 RepID=A0A9P7YFF4_9HELO|nr:hypothetical protein BJ875DRAFT_381526 [Amylocarpus encephaloides]
MAIMSTLGGWVAVIAVGGGFYYYHRRPAQRPTAKPHTVTPAEKQEGKAKKTSGKSNEKVQKKTPHAPKSDEKQATPPAAIMNEGEDEVDNQEFARQIASIKAGHNPAANKSKRTAKQKSVKQSKAQEKAAVELSSDNATAPSSANGGDADDDQSSVNSPELNATKVAAPVTDNSGVLDMLEKSAARPSVLKITESVNPTQPKKAKAPATFEAVETKKQRQNRKKAEAAKEARLEEEKERKVLMEKQRRTAREAEGRAAKDGSAFMASKVPEESVWVAPTTSTPSKGSNGVNGTKSADVPVKLLDTFQPAEKKVQAKPADAVYSESQLKGSDWQKQYSSLPSEEEQERIAIEESDEWQTVKSKTKEKRKLEEKVVKENVAPKEKPSSVPEQSDFANPPVITPTGDGQKWETSTAHKAADGSVVERQQEYQDDEWEVA